MPRENAEKWEETGPLKSKVVMLPEAREKVLYKDTLVEKHIVEEMFRIDLFQSPLEEVEMIKWFKLALYQLW